MATPLIPTFDVEGVAKFITDHNVKNILVMCGAGISVAAGIPDFRTPGTGLYAQVSKYNLPRPESLFTLDYLRENPSAFYTISNEMKLWPDTFAPTHVHHFIRLLQERGILLKCCTQNIDSLERTAGLDAKDLIEAHGTFASASCIDCKVPFDTKRLREIAEEGSVPRCESCGGIVKPDVVFFGESLPSTFIEFLGSGCLDADLLIVIGTSLRVFPFAALVDQVRPTVPRIVINNQRVGDTMFFLCDEAVGEGVNSESSGSDSGEEGTTSRRRRRAQLGQKAVRDVFLKGNCQEIVADLAKALGFGEELERRVAAPAKEE
jgi:NAD+-dependent protein deacetylase SIR2